MENAIKTGKKAKNEATAPDGAPSGKSLKEGSKAQNPYKMVSREAQPEDLAIKINNVEVGNGYPVFIAGPCAVESKEQIIEAAIAVKEAGAQMLRAGAYKPRTSYDSFQGLKEKGLEYLALAKEKTGLPIVTEVVDTRDVALVSSYADVLQIGSRNCQNYALLIEAGKQEKPVLFKRGMAVSCEIYLQAAEYIAAQGNRSIILCCRGILPEEKGLRAMPDIGAIPLLKEKTYLPVIFDPSHATGNYKFVSAISRAAIAAGADGLIIEAHPYREKALCDGQQSLSPKELKDVISMCKEIYHTIRRKNLNI